MSCYVPGEKTERRHRKVRKERKAQRHIFANFVRFAVRFTPSSLWILTPSDNLRGGDQHADVGEDQEETDERCEGEEQGCACAVGGAE